jgi:hypothetical protein
VYHDHEFPLLIGEDFPDTAGMGNVNQEADAEDILVPANAGVDVSDGEREMMEFWSGNGAGHR